MFRILRKIKIRFVRLITEIVDRKISVAMRSASVSNRLHRENVDFTLRSQYNRIMIAEDKIKNLEKRLHESKPEIAVKRKPGRPKQNDAV